jgi:hypothetical protein
MTRWQPIETAPKDGTDILVWEGGSVGTVWFSQVFGEWLGPYPDFTHWMPLPDPPEHPMTKTRTYPRTGALMALVRMLLRGKR